jgi:DNA-binding NarL/FixJ family response regulator
VKPLRVLLADDYTVVVEGLHRILEPDFEIVGKVADGRALVAATERLKPDIILTDFSMPLLNGIEAARQIRGMDRKVRIIFLSMHPDVAYVAEALRAGGSAYVLKSSAGAELLAAIREARAGRTYVSPSIDRTAVEAQMKRAGRRLATDLTPRQREVLQLIAEGRRSKEIAEILHLAPRTIEFHRYSVMKALGLRTTTELVHYAIKRGIAHT